MSLELAAQHLASRGRKGDSMLVHMAPEEVSGLQALAKAAGGTLTLNPDTGLPEANFLKSLLPTLIGAGLSFIPGVGPLMAAGIVGGLQTARTGSLGKGLMAGLGAYGGAGLASGLTAAGAGAAGAGTQAGMPELLGNAGAELAAAPATFSGNLVQAGKGIGSLGTTEGFNTFLGNAATKTAEATGMGGASGLMKTGLAAAAPMLMTAPQTATPAPDTTPHNFTFDYGRMQDPQLGYDGAYTGERTYFNPTFTRRAADGGMMNSTPIEAMSDRNQYETVLANGGQRFAEGGAAADKDRFNTMTGQSADAFNYLMGQTPAPAAPAARPTAQPLAPVQSAVTAATPTSGNPLLDMFRRLKPGAQRGSPSSNFSFDPNTGAFTRLAPTTPEPEFSLPQSATNPEAYYAKAGGIMSLAQGGQSHLGDYSDGGRLLKGPGDGVSDSIPATIANKRPARLADGEFVVPARIVSELGNGSTEAGARKLYAMMDRVQKARGKTTGKNRVAVNSRAEKLLPA